MEGEPKLNFAELEAKVRDFKSFLVSLPDNEFDEKEGIKSAYQSHLEQKYPNVRRYRIFHELIGSSEDDPDMIREDFPGEDSVELFIDSLINSK
jgi:hypothetical protein